jgi:TPR repeat protein
MNPHEKSEINPTEDTSVQRHTPSQVFNLVLAAQNGSAEACMEAGRCFAEGDGVPENQVAACAWLLLAAADGSEAAEKEFALLISRLSPEEIQEVGVLANEYSNPPAAGHADWVAGFNQTLADKLARQEGQTRTAAELFALLGRADADDEEALRILDPMLDDLKEQMSDEEMGMLAQQIIDGISAEKKTQLSLNERTDKDRELL